MNIAFDPWIPCVRRNGVTVLQSLFDCIINTDNIAFATNEIEEHALIRLCTACIYGAFGVPETNEAIQLDPDKLRTYLAQQHFSLFDEEHPFLQMPNLSIGHSSVRMLDITHASDRNSLEDESSPYTDEKLALLLVTHLLFGLGGRTGNAQWKNDPTNRGSAKAAPCSKQNVANVYLRGKNVPETINFALVSCEQLGLVPDSHLLGRPIWEMMPKDHTDTKAIQNAQTTFLGRYIPLSRFVHLHSNRRTMSHCAGLDLTIPVSFNEPFYSSVIEKTKDSEERKFVSIGREHTASLRLAAVLIEKSTESVFHYPPVLENIVTASSYTIVVVGVDKDPAKPAKFKGILASSFILPSLCMQDEYRLRFLQEITYAQNILEKALIASLVRFELSKSKTKSKKKDEKKESCTYQNEIAETFWSKIETQEHVLYDCVQSDTRDAWIKVVEKSAQEVFGVYCKPIYGVPLEKYYKAKKYFSDACQAIGKKHG